MAAPTAPPPAAPESVPEAVTPDGSLGLLAVGYRGLVAWRAARGPGWTDALGLPPLPDPEGAAGAAEGERPAAD